MSAEYVRQLGTDELCQWLRTQLDEYEWKDAESVIRKQKIKGKHFFDCTLEDWERWTLPERVAKSLVQITLSKSKSFD